MLAPNPAHSGVVIFRHSNKVNASLKVYNVSGKLVYTSRIQPGRVYPDTHQHPVGLYVTEIKNKQAAERIMFVKE